jgi:hypothetical protein
LESLDRYVKDPVESLPALFILVRKLSELPLLNLLAIALILALVLAFKIQG